MLNGAASTCTRCTPAARSRRRGVGGLSRARSPPSEPARSRFAVVGRSFSMTSDAVAAPPAAVARRWRSPQSGGCTAAIRLPPTRTHQATEPRRRSAGSGRRSIARHDRIERIADEHAEHDRNHHRLGVLEHQHDGNHRQHRQRGAADVDRHPDRRSAAAASRDGTVRVVVPTAARPAALAALSVIAVPPPEAPC